MLLRASSEAIGADAKLEGTVGRGDSGLPHGGLLVALAEAATRGTEDLAEARDALVAAIGETAFIEAGATTAIFNGLVRVADSTGIPLDDGTRLNSQQFREELDLNRFGGAANTDLEAADGAPSGGSVAELFSGS